MPWNGVAMGCEQAARHGQSDRGKAEDTNLRSQLPVKQP